MKILIIHNRYLEKGGEDEVVGAEAKLLGEHGHQVVVYEKSNESIQRLPFLKKFLFILRELNFSTTVYRELKEIIKKEKPDIAHLHNIFICISPSAYLALKEENVPIVQTLHNYRFFCLRGTFFNNKRICEKCKNKRFFHAIIGRCWRGYFVLSCFLAKLLYGSKSFIKNIDSYIVLSKFSRDKFIEFGLEGQKMHLKGNFLIAEPKGDVQDHNYALFIGRLVDYKGVETLIRVFKANPRFNLKIIGDGPLKSKVVNFASSCNNISWMGKLNKDSVFEAINKSSFLIFPSEWYETFGMVLLESFALSKPVLASNLGASSEFIIDGENGFLFEPGNEKDLAKKLAYLFSHEKERVEMGKNAYKLYRERFDKEKNYRDLMKVYAETVNLKK